MKRLTSLFLSVMLLFSLASCGADDFASVVVMTSSDDASQSQFYEDSSLTSTFESNSDAVGSDDGAGFVPVQGEYYYDLDSVVIYLDYYGMLPDNYITKDDAQELGWSGGSVERYLEGAAIGGDRFGNREGLLPKADGRSYTECDLNTDGQDSRGAERLVFSNDGLYFYTWDHYETFTEVWVEDGSVVW